MRLAVMQPYFFPYLGYLDLINNCDFFLVWDTVQFPRRGWVNRNRVLHPSKEWRYLTVPLESASFRDSRKTLIKDVRVAEGEEWKAKMVRQLFLYRKGAPFFEETLQIFSDALATGTREIATLSLVTLNSVCQKIGIEFRYGIASEMDLEHSGDKKATERILEICHAVGADEYINLPGGRNLYDKDEFAQQGVDLIFRDLPPFEYPCEGFSFVPNLSIIDALMWSSPKTIRNHLDAHRLD